MNLEIEALAFVVERAEQALAKAHEETEDLRLMLTALVADHGPFPVPTKERLAELEGTGELVLRSLGADGDFHARRVLTFETEAERAEAMRAEFDKAREDGAEPSEAPTTIHEPPERR